MKKICALAVMVFACASHAQLKDTAADSAALAREALGSELGVASVAVFRGGALSQATVYRAEPGGAIAAWAEPQAPVFEIGSVSKVFTGLLLAQAVEQGDLALTDTLGTLLKGKVDGMAPGVAAINLRQLVTHTSCLPRQVGLRQSGQQIENEIRKMTRAQLWAGLAKASTTGSPPCVALYSNFGFAVLGELLSERYGKPWDVLVAERITGPLGMKETATRVADDNRLGIPFNGDDEALYWGMEAYAGAGGLRSTAADMVVFARAVAAGRQGPLGAAAERLVTPLAPYEGQEVGYAVGLRGPEGRRIFSHEGQTGGYRALWMVLPQGEAMVALVSNAQAPIQKVSRAVNRSLFPVPLTAVPVDPAALTAYEGVFRFDREGVLGFAARDGTLYVRSDREGFSALVPVGPGRFVRPESVAQVQFAQEPQGVSSLTLEQAGRTVTATRDAASTSHLVAPTAPLAAYAGRYRMPWGAVMHVTAGEHELQSRLPRQWRLPVFAMPATDRFAYALVKAELQFERDAQGKVTALTLHQNGVHRAPRIGD